MTSQSWVKPWTKGHKKGEISNSPESIEVGIKLKVLSRAFQRCSFRQNQSPDGKVMPGQSLGQTGILGCW